MQDKNSKLVDGRVKDPSGETRSAMLSMKMTRADRARFYRLAKRHAKTGADFLVLLINNEKKVSTALETTQR